MPLTENHKIQDLFFISIPWILSWILSHHPLISYLTAFFGSWFIFYYTILSPWNYHPANQLSGQNIMRPIVLIQLIFAGFMCCTSIFYFADHLGYEYFEQNKTDFFINEQTFLIARSQRLVLLAHIALVTGIQYQTRNISGKYSCNLSIDMLLIRIYIAVIFCSLILDHFPAFLQIKYYLLNLSTICIVYLLISGLVNKKVLQSLAAAIVFGLYLLNASLSGYKEPVFISFILLGFVAFPHYKKTVLALCIPVLCLCLYCLPTLTAMLRATTWKKKKSATEVRHEALKVLLDQSEEATISNNNWNFLTKRFSETPMFCKYISVVPEKQPYYRFDILKNSLIALIPRALWSEKPNTEKISMERVYSCGVVNRWSSASAKTRPVTDAYLSGGPYAVFFCMFLYGMLSQWLSNKAEELFGSYQLGCSVLFNGVFIPLWRGNNWEFIINNIVYGFMIMLLIFLLLRIFKILQKKDVKNPSDYPFL